jgi:hypothetical protein
MEATVRSGPAVTLSTGTAALAEAQASLSNWLTVEVHLVIKETPASPESLADLVITLDYGRVTRRATYQPAPA